MRKIIFLGNATLAALLVFSVLLLARDAVMISGGGNEMDGNEAGLKEARKAYSKTMPFRKYGPVLKNNVFGIDGGKLTAISKTGSDPRQGITASPDRVALKVFGTVAWDEGKGYAFVKGAKNTQNVIKTGEEIPGSGVLERVYSDHIIVRIGGTEYTVKVIEVQPAKSAESVEGPGRGGDNFARATGEGEYVVNRIAVEDSIKNPQRLMTDARMLPYRSKDKKQRGFSLSEVKAGGIYHMLGLRNGDILLGVNGLELTSMESALQAFTALKGSDRIEVDVIRNNESMTLNYTLR